MEGDLNTLTADDFPDRDYDCFYHLAWAGVASQDKNNLQVQLNNIELSVRAMELCHSLHCDRYISAGTVAEYVFSKNVMDLEEKQTPNDMYGAAKTATHYFLQVRARQLDQRFIWAVIPSTYGEFRKDNNIITYTIRTLLAAEKPSYGALTQMWDFLYVADVARALRMIGEYGKADTTYGIGSGVYKPLKDYIITIRDIIDPTLPLGINERPSMTNQTLSSCVNILDLVRDTGFQPEVSFADGIRRTVDYWRKRNEGIQAE